MPWQSTLATAALLLACGFAFAQINVPSRWWSPAEGRYMPERLSYDNELGRITVLNGAGNIQTRGHPFFEPLGSNGRACITCHQPADGMSISVATLRERWNLTQGQGSRLCRHRWFQLSESSAGRRARRIPCCSTGACSAFSCPGLPTSRSGETIKPEFTIEVVRDPTRLQHRCRAWIEQPEPDDLGVSPSACGGQPEIRHPGRSHRHALRGEVRRAAGDRSAKPAPGSA